MLSDALRHELVALARQAVRARVAGGQMPGSDSTETFRPYGVFVTLKHRGQLRGCLGTLEDQDRTLHEEVIRCATDAATVDPRFAPVTAAELPELSIEVSVLGPLEQIDPRVPGAIVIGRHGLVVESGRYRGLLLPQVATEWGWTLEQFLRQTCVKARLDPDAWQNGALVYRFEAEVFGD